jgi:U3 small nucleolar ribonucleoprotein component
MNPLLQSVQLALQNATQKESLSYIDKVVEFCIEQENGKVLEDAPKEYIRLLVAYNMAKDTIVVEHDENENVTGLMVWYKCNEDDGDSFFLNWEADKEDGNAIFGALLFAKDTKTFQSIFKNFISKCPEVKQKQFMGLRYRSGVKTLVKYTNKFFDKILNK